nr:hypothetical protein [Tanacetum cinerariifolium]
CDLAPLHRQTYRKTCVVIGKHFWSNLQRRQKQKGLAVLSEVALSEAEQMKLATKRSKKYFYISHASGSGDGVDTRSKVPDRQVQKTSGTAEGTDSKDEDDIDDDGDNDDAKSDNHDDASDDERTESGSDEIPDPNLLASLFSELASFM